MEAMTMRLIDADALGVGRCSKDVLPADYCEGWNSLIGLIENAPIVDAVPVRHGRWIEGGYVCGENEYECSVCHETEWRTSASRMKYCMFCGAKTDGGG